LSPMLYYQKNYIEINSEVVYIYIKE